MKNNSPYNANKDSNGFFGDGTGMAGARRSFENGVPLPCDSPAGGCQGAIGLHPGDVGSRLGPFAYGKNSVLETFAESFSGPHDWLRHYVSQSYLPNGDAVNYTTLLGKAYDRVANYALIPIASPFAAGALIGVSPGAVSNVIMYDNERR